jgi:hypothetical protein
MTEGDRRDLVTSFSDDKLEMMPEEKSDDEKESIMTMV